MSNAMIMISKQVPRNKASRDAKKLGNSIAEAYNQHYDGAHNRMHRGHTCSSFLKHLRG